jgi:hypothetical protein
MATAMRLQRPATAGSAAAPDSADDLSGIPRPADAEDTCVIRNLERRWSVCWWRFGRVPEPFGPAFETAGEALAASCAVREKLDLG